MKSLGFNLARVDNIDWNYMESNQSGLTQLLTEVGKAGDSNGIYCIYHFGGGFPKFPTSLTSLYGSSTAFYSAWWANATVPSGKYAGMSLWEASFQGLWKPLIQAVDSHPSTIGYGMWNEPSNLPANPLTVLHNYYEYVTQRIRTLSDKATVFQITGNGGGDAYSIPVVAPTPDLKPYVFEGHMYSYNSSYLSGWFMGVQKAGAFGFVGETHLLDTTFYTQVHNQDFAITYYSWVCGGSTSLLDTNCNIDSQAQQLSRIYSQIWG